MMIGDRMLGGKQRLQRQILAVGHVGGLNHESRLIVRTHPRKRAFRDWNDPDAKGRVRHEKGIWSDRADRLAGLLAAAAAAAAATRAAAGRQQAARLHLGRDGQCGRERRRHDLSGDRDRSGRQCADLQPRRRRRRARASRSPPPAPSPSPRRPISRRRPTPTPTMSIWSRSRSATARPARRSISPSPSPMPGRTASASPASAPASARRSSSRRCRTIAAGCSSSSRPA